MHTHSITAAPKTSIPFPERERRRLILSVFREEEYAADERLHRLAVLVWAQRGKAEAMRR